METEQLVKGFYRDEDSSFRTQAVSALISFFPTDFVFLANLCSLGLSR
jgi:hypothetical protein